MTSQQFRSRHFTRADAFALGLGAGAAVATIVFAVCQLLTR